MRPYKSTIKVGDKQVPITIDQFDTIDEAVSHLGYVKMLKLVNYSLALTRRDRKRREILAEIHREKGKK